MQPDATCQEKVLLPPTRAAASASRPIATCNLLTEPQKGQRRPALKPGLNERLLL